MMHIEYKNGVKKVRCKIRGKLFNATPEEVVRQTLLIDLIEKYGVPINLISVEERLDKYGDNITNDRADIIIDYLAEDGQRFALILVECKKNDIPLTYKVNRQIERYNEHLGGDVKILGITNGKIIDWSVYDDKEKRYLAIKDLPSYENILQNEGYFYVEDNNFENYDSNEFDEVPYFIKSFVSNLSNLFRNKQDTIPLLSETKFNFLKDLGLRLESNGNSGGGNWEEYYRCVLLNAGQSDNFTISFCVFPGEYVYLVCSFDDNTTPSHNSLQLLLNDWIRIRGSEVEIWHDGTITVGNLGRAKNDDMIKFVSSTYPELVVNQHIFLGKIDNSKKMSFQDEDVKLFILNLTKYVLCREQFRVEFKNNSKANS